MFASCLDVIGAIDLNPPLDTWDVLLPVGTCVKPCCGAFGAVRGGTDGPGVFRFLRGNGGFLGVLVA